LVVLEKNEIFNRKYSTGTLKTVKWIKIPINFVLGEQT